VITILSSMAERTHFDVVLRGYDRVQVDEVVQLVGAALRDATPPTREQARAAVGAARFSVVLRGYDRTQVDAYLAGAARQLAG
jgi:DivIVA domain-containing protein